MDWTYFESLFGDTAPGGDGDTPASATGRGPKYRRMLGTALLYFNVLREVDPLGKHQCVVIGNSNRGVGGLSRALLQVYDRHIHEHVFPPRCKDSVREMIGDGHQKVRARICGAQAAADAHNAKHGWFMLVHPPTLRILSVTPQTSPEGNNVVTKSLVRALPNYPMCDGFLMDRVCQYAPSAQKDQRLAQIEYYGVDNFHAKGHVATCKYCGKNCLRLKRRFRGVNGSACESVFAWFRTYAKILATTSPVVHHFYVLLWSKMHNQLMEKGERSHLPVASQKRGRRAVGYACGRDAKRRRAQ